MALSAASWFLLIQPERAEAAETREQTVAAEQANAQLEIRIEQLRQEYADLPARQAELAAIRQALPEEPALAALIRDINTAAVDSGIVVDAVTTGAASAVVDPEALTAVEGDAAAEGDTAAEGGDGADDGDTEPTEGDATDESSAPPVDPDGGAVPADAGSGVSEVPGAPAGAVLASIPLTIDTTGDFYQSNLLIKNLQTEISRALLIDGLTIQVFEEEGEDGEEVEPGMVSTTITARVFAFVDPDSVEALESLPAPASTTD
ncbi:hypothetical protein [Aquipuribacter sp. MA13-13]|uniref:hypothetical protein n=1 Tax=Aquipuribacter sp. MA13-13 TaxID=3440840 RepID=UPI003EF0517D